LSPCSFFASVKSPFPAALSLMRRKPLFVVLLAVVPGESEVTLVRSLKGTADRVNRLLHSGLRGVNPSPRGFDSFGQDADAEAS
jgi:hypothetical protein